MEGLESNPNETYQNTKQADMLWAGQEAGRQGGARGHAEERLSRGPEPAFSTRRFPQKPIFEANSYRRIRWRVPSLNSKTHGPLASAAEMILVLEA